MKIKEVSQRTGLTIKTIRFYEQRGLIAPKQQRSNGRSYRDYQDSDVEQLQMVAVLRKCLFSIEQILTMEQHPELTPEIFTQYRQALLEQRELLEVLAQRAEALEPETLHDPETLARRMTATAKPLPLPNLDREPNFGQFDQETPEERRAAYLHWQKYHKYRFLRWLIPLCVTVFVLLVITAAKAGTLVAQNLAWYDNLEHDIALELQSEGSQTGTDLSYIGDFRFYQHLCYLAFDGTGTRMMAQDGDISFLEEIDRLIFPNAVRYDSRQLQDMTDWAEGHSMLEGRDIRSGLLRQSFWSVIPVAGPSDRYLLLHFRASPVLEAMESLSLYYLLAAFLWLIALSLRATKGYGFRVAFIRSYGLRGTWNDAILSVDEDNGNATMLTHQYTGMNNLVNMDYHKKDEE